MIERWFLTTDSRGWLIDLIAAAVALTALRQLAWLYRGRVTKRWKAVLDAYAERQIARDRRRGSSPTTVEADARKSNSFRTLKDHLAGELTDRAYPVVLRQGVNGFSVDVELAIWKAIDRTLHEMMQPLHAGTSPAPPTAAIVLARLNKPIYQAALRHGFRGNFADVQFGLWDAFHTGSFPRHIKDVLRTLFRRSKVAAEERTARSPTQTSVIEQQVALDPRKRSNV